MYFLCFSKESTKERRPRPISLPSTSARYTCGPLRASRHGFG